MSAHFFVRNYAWMANFCIAFDNQKYLIKNLSLKTLCFKYIQKNNIKLNNNLISIIINNNYYLKKNLTLKILCLKRYYTTSKNCIVSKNNVIIKLINFQNDFNEFSINYRNLIGYNY